MPSEFSQNLRIELIGNGDQAGSWGTTTNTNLGTLIEDAISGYDTVSVTTTSQAFTYADGAADQARNAMIELTTITGADFNVFAPPSPKTYIIYNASDYTATIYNSAVIGVVPTPPFNPANGVAIPAGKKMSVFTDGAKFYTIHAATAALADEAAALTTTLPINKGGTNAITAAAARTNLGVYTVPPVSTTGAYTLLATDVGQSVQVDANVTVPPSVFSAGDVVVVYNNSASAITVLRGSGVTMYWVGGVNNDRALTARGLATLLCVASNVFVITGQGLE
jgi:hypothetical protein